MILLALTRYYERLREQGSKGLAPPGYSPVGISYEIVLNMVGDIVAVNDIRETSGGKLRPKPLIVPQPPKRSSNIAPCFLSDKTSYVLGVSATSKRTKEEHAAFKARHLDALNDADDPGLQALCRFLRRWTPEQFVTTGIFNEDMLDATLVFRLDGSRQYLHERETARVAWARLISTDDTVAAQPCLITGKIGAPVLLHPFIKGVRGAQSSGASIVSFNLDAFKSFGKEQGANAPVSQEAAFAYTTALNHLLRAGPDNFQKLQIGDITVVFWAEADDSEQAQEAELTFGTLLNGFAPDDDSEAQKIRNILDNIAQGRPLDDVNPKLNDTTLMYVLGLAPNASRLSIRLWEIATLGTFAHRILQHTEDFHIEPLPWKTAPSTWRVALATAPIRTGAKPKIDDVATNLASDILRSVLTGHPYPRSMLATTLMRMRSDHVISGLRVAICKAIPTRERRLGLHQQEEKPPVSLNKESKHPGYRLGRLFATLEDAQRCAQGKINATIRDRYYGAASSTPASVFPILLRNTQNHLSKLRKDKPGLAASLEKDIREIIDGLPEAFPRSLPMEAQGQFAIGYYHQFQARFQKSTQDKDDEHIEEIAI
ncbi:type I-C CRISPR-associated protein Cas8c/Csd1 [Castellaniella sp.]|uniref:type I-C CRISPR-associated protein Cas8c/Csd1 n=1 Tax=Castellaniella sp. TaxID=1955812 RepID=UPI003562F000